MFFGGHLPESDPATVELLRNPEVLHVLKGSSDNREIIRDGDVVVWAATLDGTPVRAAFWLGDAPTTLRLHVDDLGVVGGTATDLWSGADLTAADGWFTLDLEPHGTRLIRLT